ncbi:PLP-dependent aminotransferase family protein [Undibacterium sp. Ren11W]|uniref:MocR-like pyridoxine biosynthesis transcription factor PdxR n=1 Tax=Undibacterium sp. Ren11W TaxID=3413045 RepID=UPI003BF5E366
MSLFIQSVQLKPGAKTALFRQLYAAIKQAILTGALQPGMQLPPTRDFCRALAVSRQTVLNAYELLLAEGYLLGEVGKGTYVHHQLPACSETKSLSAPSPVAQGENAPGLSQRGLRYADTVGQSHVHQDKTRVFRVSMPGLDAFPFDTWARLEARRWRHHEDKLGYSDSAGYQPLRELLAVYLKASRGVNCHAGQIIITSGSQQALYLLPTVLLDPGDAAWVEYPGYRGAIAPLLAAQVEVCPVPVDVDGLDVAYGASHYPHAKLVYVTPSHQLPLGMTMSLQRRLALLAWAKQQRAWVIEDDYDSEYRYNGAPLASLQSLDQSGNVIYVGTLSKVLFPGLRLGYMVLPEALVQPMLQAKTIVDKHTGIVPQMVLTDFMAEGHFGRHIKRSRKLYAQRQAALLHALDTTLKDELSCAASDGGLDLAVHFRRERDEQAVVQAGLAAGIELRGLSYYAMPTVLPAPANFLPGLLLGFSSVTEKEIAQGAAGLLQVLRTLK